MSRLQRIEAPVTFKAYMMCGFAAFAGILCGYDSGYISSVLGMPAFKRQYGHVVPIKQDQTGHDYYTYEKSLIVAILSAGTFIGALASGYLADKIGRRVTIIGPGCGLFATGVIIQVSISRVSGLVAGRLISGLGVGCVSAVSILYMSEIAPRRVRGAIVSCFQFAITVGLMLASCVGYATRNRETSAAYRIPIGLQMFFAVSLATGLFFLPESPRYWVKKNRLDKAAFALARLRGQAVDSTHIEDELAEIVASQAHEVRGGEGSWMACFRGGVTKSNSNARKVFIGTMLQACQQWTGINFIFYYNTTFLQQLGLSNPFLISMVTTVVNVVSTPISFYAIERLGRRPLLIWGGVGMCVCEFIIAIVGVSAGTSDAAAYVLIVFVCIYVFCFASTWGPAAWVVIGEIFHLPIRSKGVALSTASNWFWNFVIGIITPFIVDGDKGDLGVKVFFIWGTTCVFCVAFAYMFVPETKGLTLEQVDQLMEDVPAYHSRQWKAPNTFDENYGFATAKSPSGGRPSTSDGGKGAAVVRSFIDLDG
ncbi:monosaccharide transporter like protein [Zymoseptoria brevis]|uniref:Monosaccharide transporter like protein n=1 Tax=Zymoseptoria brevis TaxID=1047168 RepID=A0A0F4G8C0_9PEZI|nr:monosaccharide transporter like protein [Zymoseptoria brevis]